MENNTLAQLDNAIYSSKKVLNFYHCIMIVKFLLLCLAGDGNYSVPGQQWNERDNYETPFTPDQVSISLHGFCVQDT